jgi:cysteine desulfurase
MTMPETPIYLDCAATTPLDPAVRAAMQPFLDDEFGNAGSRTHAWGQRARAAVEHARDQIAEVAGAARGDVIFTSGATESNNLAILGLAGSAGASGHIVSSAIEHHAVLGPIAELERRGFSVTLVPPDGNGVVAVDRIMSALRPDTLLVSLMHVNNETGAVQPIGEVARELDGTAVHFHVDAAQSFAREIETLRHPRIDMISASAHKIGGPKGIGAVFVRDRRAGARPPLRPLMVGGGQERGLRPGTMPVALAVGFGVAAERAASEAAERWVRCARFRESLLAGLAPLDPAVNGDPRQAVPYIINLAFPGMMAEVVIDAWQDLVAVSNGAACTTQQQTCSHVLDAMQVPGWRSDGAVRLSWDGSTPEPEWRALVAAVNDQRVYREPAST